MKITVSGERAEGKTTLLKLLQEFLKERGYLVGCVAVTNGPVEELEVVSKYWLNKPKIAVK